MATPRATSGRYKGLRKTSFALPASNSYPINTASRARSALSRVAANGTTAQQATVKRAVANKYPSINVGGMLKGKKPH